MKAKTIPMPKDLSLGQFGESAGCVEIGKRVRRCTVMTSSPTPAQLRALSKWCLQAAEWMEGAK
jgi:hypothetical protein